ncbi:MAG: rod shape-determining protein RodA [Nitrospirae bacterium]|nr:rod shape-determining protein RodA [Nitrospirota bacterium]
MQASARIWRHFDVWLLATVALLTIAGVAMIRSAIADNPELVELNVVGRQAVFGLVSLVLLLATAAIDYRLWSALSRPIYVFNLLFLALIPIAGVVGFGSARWFQLATVTIQPSELAKILMIIVLANFLARNRDRIHELRTILRSFALVAVPAALILIQPDLSTAIVLLVIWLALVWAAGARMSKLAILVAVVLLVAIVLTPLLVNYIVQGYPAGEDFFFLRNYQMTRLVNFIFPNPEESFGATYNVEQALISIGSGGLLGQGYGSGTQVQLRFLKVRHTDFIFSSMSQEFGFIGATIFLLLIMFVIYRCLRAARMARDGFGSLICYGVAILLLFQASFNVGMNLNLLPVSGLPLPFLSQGGSSLLTILLGIGLVESVMLRHKRIEL